MPETTQLRISWTAHLFIFSCPFSNCYPLGQFVNLFVFLFFHFINTEILIKWHKGMTTYQKYVINAFDIHLLYNKHPEQCNNNIPVLVSARVGKDNKFRRQMFQTIQPMPNTWRDFSRPSWCCRLNPHSEIAFIGSTVVNTTIVYWKLSFVVSLVCCQIGKLFCLL